MKTTSELRAGFTPLVGALGKVHRASLVLFAVLAAIFILAALYNAILVDDDIYSVQALPALVERQGFWRTFYTLLFNGDIRSEYRLFGLSRVVHFLLVMVFGTSAWPYAAILAASQVATAFGIYWLLLGLRVDRFQAGVVAFIWLFSPFAATSAFWHYSYFILPYQLTVACALVLQHVQAAGARVLSGWHAVAAILGLTIAWTGEAHLAASLLILAIVVFATPSTRPTAQRFLDLSTVVVAVFVSIALHRWYWAVLSGGFHGTLRFEFALPTLSEVYERTAAFIKAFRRGAKSQIVPIVAFARWWAVLTAIAAAVVIASTWRFWWRREVGEAESRKEQPRSTLRVGVAMLLIFLASAVIMWLLAVLSGYGTHVLYRRYGYVPYTLFLMSIAALLVGLPYNRLRLSSSLALCASVVWLWITLNFVCWPIIRAQDEVMWSELDAVTARKSEPSLLFVVNWDRPEMPGFQLGGGTPGLRGQSFPEIFESPLGAYWWESEYAMVRLGLRYVGYKAIRTDDGRVRMFGNGLLRDPEVSIPHDSMAVVVNPSVTSPHWNADLRSIKVFDTWDAYARWAEREMLGLWQTPKGKVNVAADNDSNFYYVNERNEKVRLVVQSSRVLVPSEQMEGQLSTEQTRIDWNDGSAWMRSASSAHGAKYQNVAGLLGQWYTNGKLCVIEFSDQDNRDLVLINEHRSRVSAALRGRTIHADVWDVRGELSPDGKRISWSNGAIWQRKL